MGFAFVMDSHFINSKNANKPMKTDELDRKGKEWLNIFKNEHIYDDNLVDESFEHRLDYFSQLKVLNYNKDTKEINLVDAVG